MQQLQFLYDLPNCACDRLLLVGLGPRKEFSSGACRKATAAVTTASARVLCNRGDYHIAIIETGESSLYTRLRDAVTTTEETLYRFEQCKSNVEKRPRPLRKMGLLLVSSVKPKRWKTQSSTAEPLQVALAQNLRRSSGNICTPTYLAEQARALGRKSRNLKVQVLEEKQMQELRMGALCSR